MLKPVIHRMKLKDFPTVQRKKICGCNTPCEDGISMTTYNDGLIMCWNDGRRFLYSLINVLEKSEEGKAVKYTSWTASDEEFIVSLVKEKGMFRGINRVIAESLGKTYTQAKTKTRNLKRQGKIGGK